MTTTTRQHNDIIQMAGLSRPIKPGMLYDCRNDCFVPGVTLWSDENITKNLQQYHGENAEFQLTLSDDIDSKEKALDISAELSLSILAGLIKVSASAHFFEDKCSSTEICRVTIHYKTRGPFYWLDLSDLGSPDIENIIQGNATHVCTGVQHGADVYFIFEKSVESYGSKKDLSVKMKASLLGIFKFSEDFHPVSKEEKEFRESISCKFIGDFVPKKLPHCCDEAKQIFINLPELIKKSGLHAKRIYLYPLSKIDSRAAKVFAVISDATISLVKDLFQEYSDFEKENQTILSKSIVSVLCFLKDASEKFKNILMQAPVFLGEEVKYLAPSIKGGEGKEQSLIDLIEKWQSSSFSPKVLTEYLKMSKELIDVISMLIRTGKSYGVEMRVGEDLAEFIGVSGEVIAFTLNEKVSRSKGLIHIYTCLVSHDYISKPPPDIDITSKELEKTDKLFKLFLGYAKSNRDKRFVITSDDSCPNDYSVAYITYRSWTRSEELKLPSIPGQPEYIKDSKTSDSLKIKIPTPEVQGDSYRLNVFENGSVVKHIENICREFVVKELRSGNSYTFNAQGVSDRAGFTPESIMSEAVCLD